MVSEMRRECCTLGTLGAVFRWYRTLIDKNLYVSAKGAPGIPRVQQPVAYPLKTRPGLSATLARQILGAMDGLQ